jgi:hypothetical protein
MSAGADAGTGADAGADVDVDADADAGADPLAGPDADATATAFDVAGDASRCVQATETSTTESATIDREGLTEGEGKPAFVLVEPPIVSLLTITAPGGRPASQGRPRGVQGRP